jgi:NAD(P)-dependent dehydrogenase (short-subunit alcohol dehydrogenase family)
LRRLSVVAGSPITSPTANKNRGSVVESTSTNVVITGASSGIGRATALLLDQLGHRVFAGVRRTSDGNALAAESSDRLTPVILDVTDEESIAAAVDTVSGAASDGHFGLVNNAGLSLNGPLELLSTTDIRKLMDVNVLGLLAVTKAFLPVLRRRHGRIINISSGHGLLAIPDKSAYAASKFAVQAISDSLRVELRPFGVSVSCVAVGKVNTNVLGKIVADRKLMIDNADPEVLGLYKPLLEFFDREVRNLPGIEPIEAARVIARELTAASPRAHLEVGPGATKMKNLARLPVRLRDWLLTKAVYSRRTA